MSNGRSLSFLRLPLGSGPRATEAGCWNAARGEPADERLVDDPHAGICCVRRRRPTTVAGRAGKAHCPPSPRKPLHEVAFLTNMRSAAQTHALPASGSSPSVPSPGQPRRKSCGRAAATKSRHAGQCFFRMAEALVHCLPPAPASLLLGHGTTTLFMAGCATRSANRRNRCRQKLARWLVVQAGQASRAVPPTRACAQKNPAPLARLLQEPILRLVADQAVRGLIR